MVVSVVKKASCKHEKNNHKSKYCSFPVNPQPQKIVARAIPLAPKSSETAVNYNHEASKMEEALGRSLLKSPFKSVCKLLKLLDTVADRGLMRETILHFSLKIYGLPKCRSEDLPLAVYFFIEDTFGIQSKIELCVSLPDEGNCSVVGVLFETILMKYNVLKNDVLLDGTEVRIKDNTDMKWIVNGFGASLLVSLGS